MSHFACKLFQADAFHFIDLYVTLRAYFTFHYYYDICMIMRERYDDDERGCGWIGKSCKTVKKLNTSGSGK